MDLYEGHTKRRTNDVVMNEFEWENKSKIGMYACQDHANE